MPNTAHRALSVVLLVSACPAPQTTLPPPRSPTPRTAPTPLDAGATPDATVATITDAAPDATPVACVLRAQSVVPPPTHTSERYIKGLHLAAAGREARLTWYNGSLDTAEALTPSCSEALLPSDFPSGVRTLTLAPPGSASCPAPPFAAPLGRAGRTELLTFGVTSSRSVPNAWQFLLAPPPPAPADAETTYVPPRGTPHVMRYLPRELTAAAREGLTVALSTGTELRCTVPCTCAQTSPEFNPAVRTVVFTPTGVVSDLLYRAPMRTDASDRPDAPAVALGTMRGAAVWRSRHGISLAWLDALGRRVGELARITDGDVGAPTVAFRGETLLVVWAQRESPDAPYTLRAFNWAPGEPTGFTVTLTTGGRSAFAPALSITSEHTVLAWMEGDERQGQIRVGSTHGEIAHVTDNAVSLTAGEGDARDPELALTPERGWIAWTTYDRAHRGGVITAAELVCP